MNTFSSILRIKTSTFRTRLSVLLDLYFWTYIPEPIHSFVRYRLHNWWYEQVSTRLRPRNKWARRAIPRTHSDKTNLIPTFLFAAVIDLVEGDEYFEVINSESDENHKRFAIELIQCYSWAKYGRHDMQKAIDSSYPPFGSAIAYLRRRRGEDDEAEVGNSEALWTDEQVRTAYDKINQLEIEMERLDLKWVTWIAANYGMMRI